MKIVHILLLHFLLLVSSYAQSGASNVDCLLLEDENSIICKYTSDRLTHDKNITFHWIDPNGLISRTRDMILPANHGSIYDYRYKSGRLQGTWTFKVIDGTDEYSTNFIIK